jgi:glycosyltransferase involved in cell wall biosynthesis
MNKLEIFIITHNRSIYLETTLNAIYNSTLKDYKLTILDNCSTDQTLEICNSFNNKIPNYKVISHPVNIGSDNNVCRAFELSTSEYTWVICDDDIYDFSYFADVKNVIDEGVIDLIHVGGHDEHRVFSEVKMNVNELIVKGYPFFKFSSFLPTTIFKTKRFQQLIIQALKNDGYPHMVCVIDVYKNNEQIYISRNKLITPANLENASYNHENWFMFWIQTSKLLINVRDVRVFFFSHLKIDEINYFKKIANDLNKKIINRFILDYLTKEDQLRLADKEFFTDFFKYYNLVIPYFIFKAKNSLTNKGKRILKKLV